MNRVLVCFLLCGISGLAWAAKPSAREIMEKNESARMVKDVQANAKLLTGGGGMQERVKEFIWWRKLQDNGNLYNTMTRFKKPAEVKNEGILFIEYPGNKNDVRMYLPAYKKIRLIESQQQSSSFMGSELSYSDMATPHAADYEHKLLKEEKCGDSEELKGLSCYLVESIPATEEVKQRTGYGRVTHWVRADNFMMAKAEYENLQGEKIKRIEAGNTKMVDSKNQKWMALFLKIENFKNGHFTQLEFTQVKANSGIEDSIFTSQNLERP